MSFGIFIRMLQYASSTNSNWCLQPDSMLCCSRLDQRIKPLVNDVLMMLWWRHLLFFWNLFSLDKIILLDTLSSDWLLRPTNQHRLEKLFIHLSEIFWCNIVWFPYCYFCLCICSHSRRIRDLKLATNQREKTSILNSTLDTC